MIDAPPFGLAPEAAEGEPARDTADGAQPARDTVAGERPADQLGQP